MRFFVISTLLLTATVSLAQYNPVGQPCDTPGGFGCEAYPNGGNAYVYTCGGDGIFHLSANCRCPTCCKTQPPWNAYCT
ncbi:hypothetical protein PM082_016739 [Marasmius tenuissimus]|nr:hypothetical protein PM082_016739 [Marasmius tenuissimus]